MILFGKKLHDKTIINSFQDSRLHQSMSHSIPLVAFDFDHTLLGNNFIDYHCSSLFVIDDKNDQILCIYHRFFRYTFASLLGICILGNMYSLLLTNYAVSI